MSVIKFWLLDINHEVVNGTPEIRLWGIDDHGKRILVIDRNFVPYFYLQLKAEADPEKVIKEALAQKSSLPLILDINKVDLKFFGKPVKSLKVNVKNPDVVTKYATALAKLPGVSDHLEDDIRYSSQYLICNDVTPCEWHEVQVEEVKEKLNARVDNVYLAKLTPKTVKEAVAPPKLRVLAFSIVCYSKVGAPKPDRDPVVLISVATNTGEFKQFVAKEFEDKPVLQAFTNLIQDFDPDIIVGYGTNRQDWPYLIERCKCLGVPISVGRSETEPHTSLYGHISITGRANVDLYDFAEDITEVKVKTLENIADFLGVMDLKKRTLIEDVEIPAYWDEPNKRPILMKFSKENTQSILGISDVMLDFAIQLASLIRFPLDYAGTAAVGFRVEGYLMHQAHIFGELIPRRAEQPYFPYKGAVVLEPKPGIHENVSVLDFKAMYPNIMIANNISPDTYIAPGEPEPECGIYIAPEVKHRFRREPPGFYKRALANLISIRDEIRVKLKKLSPKSSEYRILDARQRAIKVITNACYGYAGWIGARWYLKPVAEATSAWGRHVILSTVELAKKLGLEVIYGDTDSVFVKYEPKKIEELSRAINKQFGLEVKPDEIYVRILFTEAKKRYCGLLPDGRLDIVGLEVVRGDWANVAKDIQEHVLEIILKGRSPSDAIEVVRNYISNLREKKFPYHDLIIWKTLTMPLEDYKVRAPHVEAAKILMKAGWKLTLGDKIGYVITKGAGKLYDKVKPYILATYDEVDLDYYVTNQIVPAALRILEIFNVKKEAILTEAKPKSLDEFTEARK
jgi:DNA polymerase I